MTTPEFIQDIDTIYIATKDTIRSVTHLTKQVVPIAFGLVFWYIILKALWETIRGNTKRILITTTIVFLYASWLFYVCNFW